MWFFWGPNLWKLDIGFRHGIIHHHTDLFLINLLLRIWIRSHPFSSHLVAMARGFLYKPLHHSDLEVYSPLVALRSAPLLSVAEKHAQKLVNFTLRSWVSPVKMTSSDLIGHGGSRWYSKVSGITVPLLSPIHSIHLFTVCQDMSGLSKLSWWYDVEEASFPIWFWNRPLKPGILQGDHQRNADVYFFILRPIFLHDASFLVSPTWSKEIRGEKARDERKDSFISRVACTNSEEDAWSWSSIQGSDGRQAIDRTCRIFQVKEYEEWAKVTWKGLYFL